MTDDKTRQNLDMTLISVFYDASINPLRKDATKKAVSCWMKQKNLPKEMLFLELGFNGKFTFKQSDFPSCMQYVRIDGNDSHKYLFQKEHLWNIAAKQAKFDKLVFVDSDIAPSKDIDWFKKCHNVLDKCLFTQGFTNISYLNKDGGVDFTRKSYSATFDGMTHQKGAPGGVYCIAKSTLAAIGWFNFVPVGGGDDLFWSEFTGSPNTLTLLMCKRMSVYDKLKQLAKYMGKKPFVRLPAKICHFYHGERKMRSYMQRQYMLLSQYPWMGRLMKDDERGLLSWIDTNHYFYHVASKLHTVNNSRYLAKSLMDAYVDYDEFCDMLDSHKKFKNQEEAMQFMKNAAKSVALNGKNKQCVKMSKMRQFWHG